MRIGAYLLWAATAITAGLFVLLGYFIEQQVILSLRLIFMRWAVLLAAVALFLGLYNLLSVHWTKLSEQQTGWFYSGVLILFFLATLILGLFYGPDNKVTLLVFRYIHLPVETSLLALLAVSLVVAGFRIIALRRDVVSVVFVATAILVLIGTGPWPVTGENELQLLFGELRNWIAQVWAAGGARGVLLGVTLGAILTGLRVLLAVDRPYGD